MADQQPADPAAGATQQSPAPTPPTSAGSASAGSASAGPTSAGPTSAGPAFAGPTSAGPAFAGADPTRAEGDGDAAARWSGSAAVPPPVPKRPWWSRRRAANDPDAPAPAVDPWADSEDWSATPAVDPWADQDTPLQVEMPFPEAMPPTRIDRPVSPTRIEAPLPPTRTDAPLPPTRTAAPMPPTRIEAPAARPQSRPNAAALPLAAPPPVGPPPAASAAAPKPRRRGWGRKRAREDPAAPVNRLPVQPRPAAPPMLAGARPAPPPWAAPPRPAPRSGQIGRPPAGPVAKRPPPPPRRKRRWPRNLFLFTLFSVVCCCGVPAYYAWPAARQYPVSAVLPQSVADLDLREDNASKRAVERLTEQLGDSGLAQGDVFAGVYADGKGKRVTVFGTTGLRLTPQADVEAELAYLTTEYHIKDITPYDLGESGVHERCGVGRSGGSAVVVCAWADHGSLATVLLTRRSVSESAELTGVLRGAVLTRSYGS